MNVFFEESGDFKVGTILSQAGEAYQVELSSGKRSKVKARDVLLQFATPAPAELMTDAQALAQEIDLDFLWEVAGQEEFAYTDLGQEYFGHTLLPHEAAGLLLRLHAAPIYFYKKGKGRYKAAPETALKAAQAGIEKKKQQALIQQQYVEQLKAQQLPDAMKSLVQQLLFKPDKNSIEYKALEAACMDLQVNPSRLMLQVGGIATPKELHLSKFLFEYFPKGTGFSAALEAVLPNVQSLPSANVQAFSIDDVTTTEIDDAFSVTQLSDGMWRIGIHIAAPALGIKPGDAIDTIARQRMSTVYMPGDKITMLPDAVVEAYTLAEGKACPALSLYVTLNPQNLDGSEDWTIVSTETKVEMVHIASNLRHNNLDAFVTEENLAAGAADYPYKAEIAVLWQWIQMLEKRRMAKRESFGLRPEQNNRMDFNFYVDDDVVTITPRKRGAPLDKIVAELMIFANSTWGKLLHEHGVQGIYRAQGGGVAGGGWAARMQVRMLAHAAPHQGLGVDQYTWSTSPLRRYPDLINQWQILACIEHGVTAPLAAPFKPKDAQLFAIISAFDAVYAAYADFQSSMERYWCLRWLAQEEMRQAEAVVLKEDVLRLVSIPLIVKLPGIPPMARGTSVVLELIDWDEVDLSIQARLLHVIAASEIAEIAGIEEIPEMSVDVVDVVDAGNVLNVVPDTTHTDVVIQA